MKLHPRIHFKGVLLTDQAESRRALEAGLVAERLQLERAERIFAATPTRAAMPTYGRGWPDCKPWSKVGVWHVKSRLMDNDKG